MSSTPTRALASLPSQARAEKGPELAGLALLLLAACDGSSGTAGTAAPAPPPDPHMPALLAALDGEHADVALEVLAGSSEVVLAKVPVEKLHALRSSENESRRSTALHALAKRREPLDEATLSDLVRRLGVETDAAGSMSDGDATGAIAWLATACDRAVPRALAALAPLEQAEAGRRNAEFLISPPKGGDRLFALLARCELDGTAVASLLPIVEAATEEAKSAVARARREGPRMQSSAQAALTHAAAGIRALGAATDASPAIPLLARLVVDEWLGLEAARVLALPRIAGPAVASALSRDRSTLATLLRALSGDAESRATLDRISPSAADSRLLPFVAGRLGAELADRLDERLAEATGPREVTALAVASMIAARCAADASRATPIRSLLEKVAEPVAASASGQAVATVETALAGEIDGNRAPALERFSRLPALAAAQVRAGRSLGARATAALSASTYFDVVMAATAQAQSAAGAGRFRDADRLLSSVEQLQSVGATAVRDEIDLLAAPSVCSGGVDETWPLALDPISPVDAAETAWASAVVRWIERHPHGNLTTGLLAWLGTPEAMTALAPVVGNEPYDLVGASLAARPDVLRAWLAAPRAEQRLQAAVGAARHADSALAPLLTDRLAAESDAKTKLWLHGALVEIAAAGR